MSQPTVLATVTGPDGWDTCYVSFRDVIDADGALVSTPEVTSLAPESVDVGVGSVALTFSGDINGVTYIAGEVLTFRAEAKKVANVTVKFNIAYETPKQYEPNHVVAVELKRYVT